MYRQITKPESYTNKFLEQTNMDTERKGIYRYRSTWKAEKPVKENNILPEKITIYRCMIIEIFRMLRTYGKNIFADL